MLSVIILNFLMLNVVAPSKHFSIREPMMKGKAQYHIKIGCFAKKIIKFQFEKELIWTSHYKYHAHGARTFNTTTFSIMTLSIMALSIALHQSRHSAWHTQHNGIIYGVLCWVSFKLSVIYAKCRYAKSRDTQAYWYFPFSEDSLLSLDITMQERQKQVEKSYCMDS